MTRLSVWLSCLLIAWSLPLAAGEASRTGSFQGVVPGKTTLTELQQNPAWGKPVDVQRRPDGVVRMSYRVAPWDLVVAVAVDDVVHAVDLTPPERHNQVEKIVPSMGFGPLEPLASIPDAARFADPSQPNWKPWAPRGTLAVFWLIETEGQQCIQVIRLYSPTAPRLSGPAAAGPSSSSPPPSTPTPDVPPPPPTPVPGAPDVDASASSAGKAAPAAEDAIAKQRSSIVQAVTSMVEKQHLSGHPVDSEIARRTVELLIARFDGAKWYFTQSDVDRFRRRGTTLADELRRGDYSLGQEVQDTFVERARERVELVGELLALEHDFTVTETLGRGDAADHAKNEQEVRELWRKLVKYRLLVHRAAGADALEARRRTMGAFRSYLVEVEHFGPDDAVDALLDCLLLSFDPHSYYMPPVEADAQEISLRQELSGIGASLAIQDGYLTVQVVLPNGPAARAGQLKVGDRILAVGEGTEGEMVDVVGARLRDAVERIRGQQGTEVRLQVLPAGRFESTVYRVTRDKVEVTNLAGAVLSQGIVPEGREGRVGYVYMPTFYVDRKAKAEGRDDYRSSTRDLDRLLRDFEAGGADVVVLDLRANGGGTLSEAIEMAGLFVDKGPVVQVKDRNGKVEVYGPEAASVAWRGPLVVFTSKASAGGAEILAGAMADYRRGLIVGDPQTLGMGTVATHVAIGPALFPRPDPPDLGTVRLTFQKFYRPSGESTQLRGVVPDVVLPSLTAVSVRGEQSLPHALAHDTIAPAAFAPLDSPIDAKLQRALGARSEARRSTSPYFSQLAGVIEHEKARWERTHDSLNEADFLAERSRAALEGDWPAVPGIAEVRADPYLVEVLAIALDYTARVRYARAQKLYGERQFGAAVEEYRRALAADAGFADGHYMLAWSLATCPDAAVRDGEAAVRHATTACDLTGEAPWHYLLCLAVAEAEAGDFDGAVEHLKQALALAPAGERSSYEHLVERFESGRPYQAR